MQCSYLSQMGGFSQCTGVSSQPACRLMKVSVLPNELGWQRQTDGISCSHFVCCFLFISVRDTECDVLENDMMKDKRHEEEDTAENFYKK